MQPQGHTRFMIVIAAIAAVGGVLFGFDTGVISGAILFIRQEFTLSTWMQEAITGAVQAGGVVGAFMGGYLADRLGRRNSIMLATGLFLLGTVMSAFAPEIGLLAAGRLVIGLAIGISTLVVPMYISEVSPAEIRGAMVSLNQMAVVIGILLSYGVDYWFAASGNWRGMFGFGVVPGLLLGIGLLFIPNSPRWLLMQNRPTEAVDVLRKTTGTPDVTEEVQSIRLALELEKDSHWGELLKPAVRMPLIVGVGLAVLQQITGINTVIYYAPTIFQFAGFHSAGASIAATASVGLVNVLLTIVSLKLIDRVGRRPLLLWGLIGMVLSLGILGGAFALHAGKSDPMLGWLTVFSLMLYVGSFAVSLGPVFWLLIAEIYPTHVRAKAMSLATLSNWAANLAVTLSFLTLLETLGRPMTFWLYALVGAIAWVFTYKLVPETRGKTLEEIQFHWQATEPASDITRF